MGWSRRFLVVAVTSGLLGLTVLLQTGEVASARAATLPRASVQVDLFRGLGNVFSRGLDALSRRLNNEGYTAQVFHHSAWRRVAQRIAATHSRGGRHIIVLIGHSLGGNAALLLARELGRSGVPVALLVIYDATDPQPVPNNVQHAVNFFQNNGIGRPVTAVSGFQGRLENIDLTSDRSVTHWNIDEATRLHDQIIARIVQIVNEDMAGQVRPARSGNRSR
jgi:pimeloyl-ACP methyl ester carboxylesterase